MLKKTWSERRASTWYTKPVESTTFVSHSSSATLEKMHPVSPTPPTCSSELTDSSVTPNLSRGEDVSSMEISLSPIQPASTETVEALSTPDVVAVGTECFDQHGDGDLSRGEDVSSMEISLSPIQPASTETVEALSTPDVVAVGTECFYQHGDGDFEKATILSVHTDLDPPYYTVAVGAVVKETERDRISMSLEEPYKMKECVPVDSGAEDIASSSPAPVFYPVYESIGHIEALHDGSSRKVFAFEQIIADTLDRVERSGDVSECLYHIVDVHENGLLTSQCTCQVINATLNPYELNESEREWFNDELEAREGPPLTLSVGLKIGDGAVVHVNASGTMSRLPAAAGHQVQTPGTEHNKLLAGLIPKNCIQDPEYCHFQMKRCLQVDTP